MTTAGWIAFGIGGTIAGVLLIEILAKPKRRSPYASGPAGKYRVSYDSSPGGPRATSNATFATKQDAQDYINDKLSPKRHPRIIGG